MTVPDYKTFKFSPAEQKLRKQFYQDMVGFVRYCAETGHKILPQENPFFSFSTWLNGQKIKIRYFWEEVYGEKAIKTWREKQAELDRKHKHDISVDTAQKRERFLKATGKDLNAPGDTPKKTEIYVPGSPQTSENKEIGLDIW